jgi:hypothetical protein
MKTIVGISLTLFGMAFGTIVLFGLFTGPKHPVLLSFEAAYFILTAATLGIVYYMNRRLIPGKVERAGVILALLLVSTSFSHAAGAVKQSMEQQENITQTKEILNQQITDLEQQVAGYNDYMLYLNNITAQINETNRVLGLKVYVLSANIEKQHQRTIDQIIKEMNATLEAQRAADQKLLDEQARRIAHLKADLDEDASSYSAPVAVPVAPAPAPSKGEEDDD